ncbi:MAG: methyl-accepting chemotaxis protein, partial [Rhodospirillales bacterium]|nr:methyl-accepting chemotaxis protein [Rhodospirillales bacterium]
LRGMKKTGTADRVAVSAVLREMLESNPNILGTYTGWEPNAFDGRDSASANTEGHDASGRFVPYWNRASGKVEVEALVDYDKDGLGDYYMLPKKLKHEVIIEPYIYPVGGRKVLMTSLVVPIIIDGTFQGIAGVDIDLADINARAAKEHPFGTGNVQLVSNGGLWVAYPKAEVLGKPIESTNAENAAFKERIKAGQGFNQRGRSVSLGITIERSVVPINIGETGTPWAAMVAMPLNEIQAPVHTIRNLLILSGALLAAALSGVMVVLASRVVGRPFAGGGQ